MTTETIERDITERKIHLELAHNVRHLGGHPTANGHDTTAFDIIRSGSIETGRMMMAAPPVRATRGG